MVDDASLPELRVRFECTLDDLVEVNLEAIRHVPGWAQVHVTYGVTLGLIVGLTIALITDGGASEKWIAGVLVGAVAAVGLYAYSRATVRTRLARRLEPSLRKRRSRNTNVVLAANGVECASDEMILRLPWPLVEEIAEREHRIFFVGRGGATISIPHRAIENAGMTLESFTAHVHEFARSCGGPNDRSGECAPSADVSGASPS